MAPSPAGSPATPESYDELLGPIQFGPFADELVALVPPGTRGEVLEIACGTGLVTSRLRARLDASARLLATDLAPDMLAYARRRHAALDVQWQQADAMQLPFDARSFDGAVCGFGLMLLPDIAAGLREIRRVLRDGGRLVFSVWDAIEQNPLGLAKARLGERFFPGDAQMSFRVPYCLGDAQALQGLLQDAGFGQVQVETRRLPISGLDPRRIAEAQVLAMPRSARLAERGFGLEFAIDQLAAALQADGGNPYSGHAQALLVQARAA